MVIVVVRRRGREEKLVSLASEPVSSNFGLRTAESLRTAEACGLESAIRSISQSRAEVIPQSEVIPQFAIRSDSPVRIF